MSAKKLVPYVFAGVGLGLCLLVIAAAGFVAYGRATAPAPQEIAAESDNTTGEEATDAEKDAEAPADAETPSDSATEPAAEPASEPAPAPAISHFYECDYFYVDVPDAWRTGTTAEDNGDGTWSFAHPEGQYVNQTILSLDPAPLSGHHGLVGTTSDGTQIWANGAATGFFGDGKATITLK